MVHFKLSCEWKLDFSNTATFGQLSITTNFVIKLDFLNDCFNQKFNTIPCNVDFQIRVNISSFDIKNDKIIRINWSLDPNKDHEHDGISILMLQLCPPTI